MAAAAAAMAVAAAAAMAAATPPGLVAATSAGSPLDAEVAARSEVAAGSEVAGAAAAGSGSVTSGGPMIGGPGGPAAHPGERAACAKSHDLAAGLSDATKDVHRRANKLGLSKAKLGGGSIHPPVPSRLDRSFRPLEPRHSFPVSTALSPRA